MNYKYSDYLSLNSLKSDLLGLKWGEKNHRKNPSWASDTLESEQEVWRDASEKTKCEQNIFETSGYHQEVLPHLQSTSAKDGRQVFNVDTVLTRS